MDVSKVEPKSRRVQERRNSRWCRPAVSPIPFAPLPTGLASPPTLRLRPARERVARLSSLFVPFSRLVHFPHWRVVAYQFSPLHPSEGRCPAVSEGCIRVPHRSRRAPPCFALPSHTRTHTHTPARTHLAGYWVGPERPISRINPRRVRHTETKKELWHYARRRNRRTTRAQWGHSRNTLAL